jgi:hypothetical protein
MDGLFAWLKTVAEQQSNLPVDTLTALLAVLRSTPAALDTLTANLEPDTWRFRPAADEWNLTEIVTHLRDVDREVNLPRFRRVISQEMAHVAGINTDLWAKERNYSAEDGPEMLRELIAVRTEMIDLLDALSSADWERKAQHTIFGPTSLRELVGFVATHDRSHVQQAFANLRAAES